jgi:hypothetical protein
MQNQRKSITDYFSRVQESSAFVANNTSTSAAQHNQPAIRPANSVRNENKSQNRPKLAAKNGKTNSKTIELPEVPSNSKKVNQTLVTLSDDDDIIVEEEILLEVKVSPNPKDETVKEEKQPIKPRMVITLDDDNEPTNKVRPIWADEDLTLPLPEPKLMFESLYSSMYDSASGKQADDFWEQNNRWIDIDKFLKLSISTDEDAEKCRSADFEATQAMEVECPPIKMEDPRSADLRISDEQAEQDGEQSANSVLVWQHFRTMIERVLSDRHFDYLLNDHDWKVLGSFASLANGSQQLLVRLLSRKNRWLHRRSIQYPDIAANLHEQLSELQEAGFLLNSEYLDDLSSALSLFNPKELRQFAKRLNGVTLHSSKHKLIESVVKYARTNRTLIYSKSESLEQVLLRRTRNELVNQCVRLNMNNCRLFYRFFLLHYLPGERDEEIGTLLSLQA